MNHMELDEYGLEFDSMFCFMLWCLGCLDSFIFTFHHFVYLFHLLSLAVLFSIMILLF